ncbi:MAG: shikimate kinase [Spirochaetaceae bacterium]|nr:MAG: shikimate kinase [Spirochaetaceae bacterium]
MTAVKGRIYLMGIKHSGKSTLGAMLARRLGSKFIDLDEAILALFSRSHHGLVTSVRDVYHALGAEGFHRIEAEAARALTTTPPAAETAQIVALGGGTIENETAWAHLSGSGVFLYLLQDETALYRRIAAAGIPPFLDSADPRGSFHTLFVRRDRLYRQRADCVVDLRERTPGESLAAIIEALER